MINLKVAGRRLTARGEGFVFQPNGIVPNLAVSVNGAMFIGANVVLMIPFPAHPYTALVPIAFLMLSANEGQLIA